MKLKIIFTILIASLAILGLVFVVKGHPGYPPDYQSGYDTAVGGPFESTNTTSRYALVEAIAQNHTFALNDEQAKAASPDLVKYNDTYMTIFTPGVSMLGVPFYLIGKQYGIPQIATFALNIVAAVINVVLIAKLSRKMGAAYLASFVAGFVFLFGTNALVYALGLTQHHISTMLMIAVLLLSAARTSWIRNLSMGALYAGAILIDIPNAFLLLPSILMAGFSHIKIEDIKSSFKISINFLGLLLIIGTIPFVVLFAYYNKSLTGSYTKLGQFLGRYDYPNPNRTLTPEQLAIKQELDGRQAEAHASGGISLPFKTREQLQGMHILLLSKQRSWIYYSPIVWLGLLGFLSALRTKHTQRITVGMFAILLMNVLLYASFGDPWGGWSFGPRYLIPSAALLCAGLGVVITRALQDKLSSLIITVIFFGLLLISVHPNVLGSITTAAIPPKGEAEALQNDTPWTTTYNDRMLARNLVSSFIYNWELREDFSGRVYLNLLVGGYMTVIALLYLGAIVENIKTQRRQA